MVIPGVIDTGAAYYIMHYIYLLTDFTTVNCMVEFPNDETTLVTHIGSMSF